MKQDGVPALLEDSDIITRKAPLFPTKTCCHLSTSAVSILIFVADQLSSVTVIPLVVGYARTEEHSTLVYVTHSIAARNKQMIWEDWIALLVIESGSRDGLFLLNMMPFKRAALLVANQVRSNVSVTYED